MIIPGVSPYTDGWHDGYEKGRADAIESLKGELIDIIRGNEEFIDWQKEEICLCLECAIENVKEQNNDDNWGVS